MIIKDFTLEVLYHRHYFLESVCFLEICFGEQCVFAICESPALRVRPEIGLTVPWALLSKIAATLCKKHTLKSIMFKINTLGVLTFQKYK